MAEGEGARLCSQVLSAYVLPGRTLDPGRIILEAQAARAAGLGGVWISERFALKEPDVLSGMVAASVPGLRIGGTMSANKLGRASCRERVCQYVEISVVAV